MSNLYKTVSYVMIVLFGIFSGFVGKSNITTYDALRSAKAMLFDDTIKYLKNWKIAQENCGGSKWILSYNGLPTNKSAPYHIIQRHSELAGIHKIKTHALRHSHASLLISLGENAIVVRDRLGHEDIKTTLGTYGHLYPNTNIEVANRLVGLINVEMNEKAIKETKKFSGNQYIKKEGK